MAKQVEFEPSKTYAAIANLNKALAKVAHVKTHTGGEPRYFITTTKEGRFHAVFIGTECLHFAHLGFCVVG